MRRGDAYLRRIVSVAVDLDGRPTGGRRRRLGGEELKALRADTADELAE